MAHLPKHLLRRRTYACRHAAGVTATLLSQTLTMALSYNREQLAHKAQQGACRREASAHANGTSNPSATCSTWCGSTASPGAHAATARATRRCSASVTPDRRRSTASAAHEAFTTTSSWHCRLTIRLILCRLFFVFGFAVAVAVAGARAMPHLVARCAVRAWSCRPAAVWRRAQWARWQHEAVSRRLPVLAPKRQICVYVSWLV